MTKYTVLLIANIFFFVCLLITTILGNDTKDVLNAIWLLGVFLFSYIELKTYKK